MMGDVDDDLFVLDITINLELPGGWPVGSIAVAALTDLFARLEHDGIRPIRTTIAVIETTTR